MSKDNMKNLEKMNPGRSRKQLRNLLLINTGLVLIALIAFVRWRTTRNANSDDVAANLLDTYSAFNVGTRIGESAPAFTLLDANGEPYEFEPGDGHKYVFAFNMGYDCSLCLQQLGALQRRIDQFHSVGAEVIGISIDSGDQARQVVEQTGVTFPLLSDPDLSVTKQFDMQLRAGWPMDGMGAFPALGYVIVDGNGIIRAQRVVIYFGDSAPRILRWLEELP